MVTEFGILIVFLICYFCYAYSDRIRDFVNISKHKIFNHRLKRSPIISKEMIREAMNNRTFGNFTLPPAVLFFKGRNFIPSEGYKIMKHALPNGNIRFQITVSVSAEKILDLFDECVILLGDTCNVVLEDYRSQQPGHVDYFAFNKDTYVVRSILLDFEELLLNDGFLGIAIYNPITLTEVQLTKYKVIQIFTSDLRSFKNKLTEFGVAEDPELKFVFEDIHLLVDSVSGDSTVEALKDRLCIDQSVMQQGGFEEIYN